MIFRFFLLRSSENWQIIIKAFSYKGFFQAFSNTVLSFFPSDIREPFSVFSHQEGRHHMHYAQGICHASFANVFSIIRAEGFFSTIDLPSCP